MRLVANVRMPTSSRAQHSLSLDLEDVQRGSLGFVRSDDVHVGILVRVSIHQRMNVEARVGGFA